MEKYDLRTRKGWSGYYAVHIWIASYFGPAKKCEWCGSERAPRWHNISREYKRERSDWMQLCAKCHHKEHKKEIAIYLKEKNIIV